MTKRNWLVCFFMLLFPIVSMAQTDVTDDKAVMFPKLFRLNNSVSVGLLGAGMDNFNYGAIGVNATVYGVYMDFMGWPRKHAGDVTIDTWKDNSQLACHIGYQIPLNKYQDGSIRLIPVIGWAKISKGYTDGSDWNVGTSGIVNSFHVTEEIGGFDYGGVLVFQNRNKHFGYFNLSFGITRYTVWLGLGVDFRIGKSK